MNYKQKCVMNKINKYVGRYSKFIEIDYEYSPG